MNQATLQPQRNDNDRFRVVRHYDGGWAVVRPNGAVLYTFEYEHEANDEAAILNAPLSSTRKRRAARVDPDSV
jgi:hypothetical protein